MATKNVRFKSDRLLPVFIKKYAIVGNDTAAAVDTIDIRRMIEEDYDVYEVKDGAEVKLNYDNYKADNTAEFAKAPTITAATQTIYTSDSYDIMNGVVATSKAGNDITDTIEIVSNSVNFRVPGTYAVVFRVVDPDNGIAITKSRTVSVQLTREIKIIYTGKKIIEIGDTFVAKNQVTAVDQTGNSTGITITVAGTVDTTKVGDYTLTYTATAGTFTSTLKVVVRVIEPRITFIIPTLVYIENSTTFNPLLGVSARYENKFTIPVTVEGTVDTDTDGDYTLTYKAEYNGSSDTATRTVTVATAPVWAGNTTITQKQSNTAFDLAQFKAGLTVTGFGGADLLANIDFYENTVNSAVVGSYVCCAFVDDTVTGFRSVCERTVNVIVNAVPVLNTPDVQIKQTNTTFDLKTGVTVTDTDDSLTIDDVVITGTVDTTVVGVYNVNYKVTDGFTEVSDNRSVTVVPNIPPVLAGISDINVDQGTTFDAKAGVSVSDADDPSISIDDVTVTGTVDTAVLGPVTLTYSVSDGFNNVSETRVVTVVEVVAP